MSNEQPGKDVEPTEPAANEGDKNDVPPVEAEVQASVKDGDKNALSDSDDDVYEDVETVEDSNSGDYDARRPVKRRSIVVELLIMVSMIGILLLALNVMVWIVFIKRTGVMPGMRRPASSGSWFKQSGQDNPRVLAHVGILFARE